MIATIVGASLQAMLQNIAKNGDLIGITVAVAVSIIPTLIAALCVIKNKRHRDFTNQKILTPLKSCVLRLICHLPSNQVSPE